MDLLNQSEIPMRLLLRFGLSILISFAGVTSPAVAAVTTCGPLDRIFGACKTEISGVEPVRPAKVRYVTVHKKPKIRPLAGSGGERAAERQATMKPPPGVAFASVAYFDADPTLRSGDIVVTPQGFLVYRGSHVFTPLDRKKRELAVLERASRKPLAFNQTSPSLAVWRPSENSEAAGASHRIRTITFDAPLNP
jgi:hypothetical protein